MPFAAARLLCYESSLHLRGLKVASCASHYLRRTTRHDVRRRTCKSAAMTFHSPHRLCAVPMAGALREPQGA
eukprot:6207336-Pleurochrysis_carterae.AAC.1